MNYLFFYRINNNEMKRNGCELLLNRILYRIAEELNDTSEYYIKKKLTDKGKQLKDQLKNQLISRLQDLVIAFKRNNKSISNLSLWNNIKLSVNQYITLNLPDTEKLNIFKIIFTEIMKENISIIDPEFTPKIKTVKKSLTFDPTLYSDYQFNPSVYSLWNLTNTIKARINFLLTNDNLLDYFIQKYDFNDEKLINICIEHKIKKPTSEYLLQLKNYLINKLDQQIHTLIDDKDAMINKLKKDIFLKFIRVIKANLSEIMPLIDFPRAPYAGGRLYAHSWQGQGKMDNRKDANPIFRYLSNNETFANQICNLANLNLNDIKQACNITDWKAYINKYWEQNYNEDLHISVRQYLIDYNKNVLAEESQDLLSRDIDIDKTTDIDYNPRRDQYRERPFIVIRKYNPHTYKPVKDVVIIGDIGANHSSTLLKPENAEIVQLNNEINNNDLFWSCGYIIGNIAFIALKDQQNQEPNNTYLIKHIYTPKNFAKLIKAQQPSIQQVFTIPYNTSGGTITRLAKKIHI